MNLVDWQPLSRLLLVAAALALLPLGWWWWRQRQAPLNIRLTMLTALTLFLTFDLIVFGAFTRLSDSGLGCPDWPGCYGHASPIGASQQISQAQAAMPTGPVTHGKAWIEMIHRYLAMVVGALILVAAGISWWARRTLPHSAWWATLTLAWVIVQGLFGKYTVTLKLYPAVVTLHLLGGVVLLAMLVAQHESFRQRPLPGVVRPLWVGLALAAVFVQIALGGWVSTNYAVLACTGFPDCNGQWWPDMAFAEGYVVLRQLGLAADGSHLNLTALVAIHMVHRLFAIAVVLGLLALAWSLRRGGHAAGRSYAGWLLLVLLMQLVSGVSNVVLDWPLAAALAHSGGAAALVAILVSLLARCLASDPQASAASAYRWTTAPAAAMNP